MNNKLFDKIVLGTEVFSGSWGVKFRPSEIKKILNSGYENGIRELDTAPIYGKNIHDVEKLLGQALQEKKLKYKINTKFTIKKDFLKDRKLLLKDLKNQLNRSLKSLKKDTIDNYFFHSGTDEEFFNDDVWEFLYKMKKKGTIKNLCLSLKHDLVQKNQLKQLYICNKFNIDKISTVCNLYSQHSLKNVIPFCKKNNLTIYGRMPLAKGLLSGKYKDLLKFNKSDPRFEKPELTKKILKFSSEIKNLSAKKAVKWSLNHCDKVIIGFKNTNQIEDIFK